jgi:hypothetical protein
MGKNVLFLLLMFLFVPISCNNPKEKNNQNADNSAISTINKVNPSLKLQIYYFHTTHRCPTCNSIEANLKQVLNRYFNEQVSDGIINFKTICVDDHSNMALIEKYKAFGIALHLIQIKNGLEIDNDLTEYAFMHSLNNSNVFMKNLKDFITTYIN